ncbi:hypothetical protein, partial [Prevotella illustrans]|uniref:hypothetical protein n=1 Tax=Prevotella illustrans TaxID=2800387 RepID=UPI001A9D1B3E
NSNQKIKERFETLIYKGIPMCLLNIIASLVFMKMKVCNQFINKFRISNHIRLHQFIIIPF